MNPNPMIFKDSNSPEERAKKLADEHWAWLEALLGHMYKDALKHGYKHGFDEALELLQELKKGPSTEMRGPNTER